MKTLKKLITIAMLMAMVGTSSSVKAEEIYYDTGGCGWEDCREAPCLTPAIALGAIALVAIIAVAVQNSHHHGHGHCH